MQDTYGAQLKEAYAELCRWADINDVKYATLLARMEASHGRHAAAIRCMQRPPHPHLPPGHSRFKSLSAVSPSCIALLQLALKAATHMWHLAPTGHCSRHARCHRNTCESPI